MSLIELRGIRKTYSDGHQALRGIDLSLGEGMFGLLGPNGAGKTTLLSILVLALEPTRKEIDRRARMLLDAVDLTDAANRPSGQYSGGMRRRLGIAQAMIHAPRMLVIDEPTAGLDPEERIHFRNRIGVLTNGALVFDGDVGELLGRAGHAASLEEAYAAELTRHAA